MYLVLIYLLPVAFICMLPILVKRIGQFKQVSIFSWIVMGLFFLVCTHLTLVGLATKIEIDDLKACGNRNVVGTALGGYCPKELSNQSAIERVITRSFGGSFDGVATLVIGIPLVTILALFGLFNSKRTWRDILWSPYLVVLVVFTMFIVGLMIHSYNN